MFGVIPDLRVDQFVQDHVIDHIRRSHDQPVGEAERAARTARAQRVRAEEMRSSYRGKHAFRQWPVRVRKEQPSLLLIPVLESFAAFGRLDVASRKAAPSKARAGCRAGTMESG